MDRLALARAQALAGDHAAAAATMASVVGRSEQFVSGYDRAAVYAALGRTDDAFAALEEGYQSRANATTTQGAKAAATSSLTQPE